MSAEGRARGGVYESVVVGHGTPMERHLIARTGIEVSRMALGCAGLGGAWGDDTTSGEDKLKAARLVNEALERGINFFDHADVYALGKAETVFGGVLKQSPGMRQQMVLQTKCGLRFPDARAAPAAPRHFDLSAAHIVASLEGSLRRLCTDYVDILVLHRVDALMEPEEVAKAFDALQATGKVRAFGVSNFGPSQIELLERALTQRLAVTQVQLGLFHAGAICDGIDFNREPEWRWWRGATGAGGIDYFRLKEMQIQAYSPVRNMMSAERAQHVQEKLRAFAEAMNASPTVIALAWLLKHPARIVPVLGTTNPKHLAENCAALSVSLTSEQWYDLLYAASDQGSSR
jgi:predicted oxidoreductase